MGGVILSIIFATFEAILLDCFPQIKIPSQFDPHTVMAFSFFISGYILRRANFLRIKSVMPLWILFIFPAFFVIFVDWFNYDNFFFTVKFKNKCTYCFICTRKTSDFCSFTSQNYHYYHEGNKDCEHDHLSQYS